MGFASAIVFWSCLASWKQREKQHLPGRGKAADCGRRKHRPLLAIKVPTVSFFSRWTLACDSQKLLAQVLSTLKQSGMSLPGTKARC